MAVKTKAKRPAAPTPRDREEMALFISSIASAQRKIDGINAELNKRVDELTKCAMAEVGPLEEKVNGLVEGLYLFAEENRNDLTDGGKTKTVDLPTGTVSWRMTPLKTVLRDEEAILEKLKARKLDQFIRTKEEVNREALLADVKSALTIPGVEFEQRENFYVKPNELQAELEKKGKKVPVAVKS